MMPPDQFTLDGATWELVRAWPRTAEEIPLELVDPDGTRVVGRWFSDPERAIREQRRTPGAVIGDDPRLLLQPRGADRRLRELGALLAEGATLVAHRPQRRAVVRTRSGTFLKLTRPGRAELLARRHDQLRTALQGHGRVPDVLAVSDDRIELAAMHGSPPCGTPDRADRDHDGCWEAVGHGLAALAVAVPPDDLPVHDAPAEAEVTRRWLDRAVAAERLPRAAPEPVLDALTTGTPTPMGVSHRDLHDGQLLFDTGPPGMLDPDTLAVAEPALDLANLLVHLDLRVEQGHLSARARSRARDRIVAGVAPDGPTLHRVSAYEAVCRLRLAAVYAFRPRWHAVAHRWYRQTLRDGARDPLATG
jgi:hypothetical protein